MQGKIKTVVRVREVLETADAERVFRQAPELDEVLGQGGVVYFQGRAYHVDADSQVELSVWTGAGFGERPYDAGLGVKLSYIDGNGTLQTNQDQATYTAPGVIRLWTEGTLRADTELVVKVKRTSGTGRKRVELDTVASIDLC